MSNRFLLGLVPKGGSETFSLFHEELGDTVVGNGKIVLMVGASDSRPGAASQRTSRFSPNPTPLPALVYRPTFTSPSPQAYWSLVNLSSPTRTPNPEPPTPSQVFARSDHVGSGAFKLQEPGKGRVNSGFNMGVSHFHNKGVVGMAFMYFGTSIAFLAAHYASDSAGRWSAGG